MGIESIYYLFGNPVSCFSRLEEKRSFLLAFFVVMLATISSTVGGLLIGVSDLNMARTLLTVGIFVRFTAIFVLWILFSSIFHLFAEWMDGQGKASVLFIALGFCFVPAILCTPVALIVEMIGGQWKMTLFVLFNLVIFFWIVRLQTLCIREVYKISTFRALIVLTAPITLGLILIGVMAIILFLACTSILSGSFLNNIL